MFRLSILLFIYLLCKSYQGRRKIMQKTQKEREKTRKQKKQKRNKKTPYTVHVKFTIVWSTKINFKKLLFKTMIAFFTAVI